MTSKSLPATEFQIYISSADSGIDSSSDSTSNSTTKLNSSLESLQDGIDPTTLLAGRKASHVERVEGISRALDWLRTELTKMKETDKHLTKSFIKMRSRIAEHKQIVESGGMMTLECQVFTDGLSSNTTVDDCSSVFIRKKAAENPKMRRSNGADEWNLIAKDEAFPTNGLNFENNKRATWVI